MPNIRRILPAGLACLALWAPLLGHAQPASGYQGWGTPYYGHMWGGGMGYGWYGWGHVLMWLGLIAVGVLIYLLARRPGDRPHHPHHGDPTATALQILNERYARGEIEKTEYEEKKAAILTGQR